MAEILESIDLEEILPLLKRPGARNTFYDEVFERARALSKAKVLPIACESVREAKLIGGAVARRMRTLKKSNPECDYVLRSRRHQNTLYIFKIPERE